RTPQAQTIACRNERFEQRPAGFCSRFPTLGDKLLHELNVSRQASADLVPAAPSSHSRDASNYTKPLDD
ncbi:hypothetical protein BGZ96_003458, partial [Linnemannia gamsii]